VLRVGIAADVRAHEGGLAAFRLDRRGDLLSFFELDVGDDDLRSLAREELGRSLADP
jgi:hypothetical protein